MSLFLKKEKFIKSEFLHYQYLVLYIFLHEQFNISQISMVDFYASFEFSCKWNGLRTVAPSLIHCLKRCRHLFKVIKCQVIQQLKNTCIDSHLHFRRKKKRKQKLTQMQNKKEKFVKIYIFFFLLLISDQYDS